MVAATDPGGRIPRPGVLRRPQTANEFAEYFRNSKFGKLNREEVESYVDEFVGKADRADAFKQSARKEIAKGANKGRWVYFLIISRSSILTILRSPYLLSIPQQIRAVMVRRVQILRGSMFFTIINLWYAMHAETP